MNHPEMPREIRCIGIYKSRQPQEFNAHGSIPLTFHDDDDLSQIQRDLPKMSTWAVRRYRLECYDPRQHAFGGRWIREVS